MTVVNILQYEHSWVQPIIGAVEHLGYETRLIRTAHEVRKSGLILVPDGDTTDLALTKPVSSDLFAALSEGLVSHPTLAIGRGTFFFSRGSLSPHQAPGLGLLDVPVAQFDENMVDPHDRPLATPYCGFGRVMGLERIVAGLDDSHRWMYFRTRFCLSPRIPFSEVAVAHYGVPFAAAARKDRLTCVGFLPELSAQHGLDFLSCWLEENG